MTAIAPTRLSVPAYWTTTAVLATECLVGGVMGALQLPPFRDTATDLGYPAYFMSILGVWYVSAGVVLLAPRLPRLKEWAYAGLVINYTGAAASHIWNGDGAEKLVGQRSSLVSPPHRGSCGRLPVATFPLPQVHPLAVAPSPTGSPLWPSRPNLRSVVSGIYCGPITSATSLSTSGTRPTC